MVQLNPYWLFHSYWLCNRYHGFTYALVSLTCIFNTCVLWIRLRIEFDPIWHWSNNNGVNACDINDSLACLLALNPGFPFRILSRSFSPKLWGKIWNGKPGFEATCLSSSACPAGSFGDGCRGVCGCRDVSECDAITGHCTCQPGYTGTACHDECPEGFYGENCSSECDCSSNGTVSCNNVNGTCDCRDNWMGDQCEIESMYVCVLLHTEYLLPKSNHSVEV